MVTNQFKVSVITLTYNNFIHLFDTILSVLEQNCEEFEYIISDDGSDDFPKEEIIRFIDEHKKDNLKKLVLLDNHENVGTVRHLNKVLKLCSGELIFELSTSDLFVNNNVISDVQKVFDTEKCEVLITSRFDAEDGIVRFMTPHYRDRKKINRLNTRNKRYSGMMRTEHCDMFIAPNVVYCDERYTLLEDAPMISKMLWNNEVSIRPDVFVVKYDCKSGVSSRFTKNRILMADIKKYNLEGKIEHFDDLDFKTRYHIRFGIEREKCNDFFSLFLICLKYSPRIVSYLIYCIFRWINSFGDCRELKRLRRMGVINDEK